MQWLAVRKFLVKSGGPCQHQVLGNKKEQPFGHSSAAYIRGKGTELHGQREVML